MIKRLKSNIKIFKISAKKFKTIPIESRTIYSQEEHIAKGALKMWCEVIPKKSELCNVKESLTGQNVEKYEMRIVIWNTRAIPFQGDYKYINIQVRMITSNGKNDVELETDVHGNSKDGNGEFNWRFVVPFVYPSNATNITFQVFDKPMLGGGTLVGTISLNAKKWFAKVSREKEGMDIPRQDLPLRKY